MSDEITVRKARHDDYEAVMEIGDVYEGRDYLPAWFHSFLDNPDIYAIVAVSGDRPVGFHFLHVLDEGESVNKRAGRVHKDFQNRGIYQLMMAELDKKLTQIDPPIKRYTFSCRSTIADAKGCKIREAGFSEIFRKRFLSMSFDISIVKNFGAHGSASLWQMTTRDIELIFNDKKMVDSFFPHSMLINRFMGYKTVKGNIKYLINDSAAVYASFNNNRTIQSNRHLDPTWISEIDMMSCSTFFKSSVGATVYWVDLYSPRYCLDTIRKHLDHHVSLLVEVTSNNNGFLMVSFHDDQLADGVLNILSDFGITEQMFGVGTHCVWWEMNLQETDQAPLQS